MPGPAHGYTLLNSEHHVHCPEDRHLCLPTTVLQVLVLPYEELPPQFTPHTAMMRRDHLSSFRHGQQRRLLHKPLVNLLSMYSPPSLIIRGVYSPWDRACFNLRPKLETHIAVERERYQSCVRSFALRHGRVFENYVESAGLRIIRSTLPNSRASRRLGTEGDASKNDLDAATGSNGMVVLPG